MSNQYSTILLLSRLQSELNRLFEEYVEFDEASLEEGEWSPRIDAVESNDAIIILAEVPGMDATDLKLEVAGNLVTLSGSKTTSLHNSKNVKFHCVERGQGPFMRRIQLLRPVNSSVAKAQLANGVLTVSFPKVEDQRQKVRVLEIEEVEEPEDG